MDLRQLRYFRAVVEARSFSAAARSLHIAQPAVSIAIRKLEAQLGLTLLHRGERCVSPTPEGLELLDRARDLLERAQAAELAMQELRGLEKGALALGVPSMLGSYFFPPLLMGFKSRYPGLRLSVREAGGGEQRRMILDGELDLGVVVDEDPDGELETRHFLREEMVVCVPRDHELAGREGVTPREFLDHELVLFQEGYHHRAFIERISRECGREPKVAFESNLIALNRAIVRRGFGITTVLRIV
ncbi:MAG: LysR family transcriptional regulator, partial [Ectothiorhodospiraceae bacterium]